jgi:hypothetical protein
LYFAAGVDADGSDKKKNPYKASSGPGFSASDLAKFNREQDQINFSVTRNSNVATGTGAAPAVKPSQPSISAPHKGGPTTGQTSTSRVASGSTSGPHSGKPPHPSNGTASKTAAAASNTLVTNNSASNSVNRSSTAAHSAHPTHSAQPTRASVSSSNHNVSANRSIQQQIAAAQNAANGARNKLGSPQQANNNAKPPNGAAGSQSWGWGIF